MTGNYWNLPTGTNIGLYSDQPPGDDAPMPSSTFNIFRNDAIDNGYIDGFAVTGSTIFDSSQNYLSDVGAYATSISPYGTFDQGGNVLEWTQSELPSGIQDAYGGSWTSQDFVLRGVDHRRTGWIRKQELGLPRGNHPRAKCLRARDRGLYDRMGSETRG
jgi:hypothetical protein